MRKIIAFDFDKTLTYKDTLFGFFRHMGGAGLGTIIKCTVFFILMVATKVKIISLFRLKELGIKLFLSGYNMQKFERQCASYSKKIQLNDIYYKDFLSLSKQEDVVIVSASFVEYLKPLFPEVKLIGSSINFKNDKPYQLENHCYKNEKVKMLQNEGVDQIDLLYTDSISDLPLAEISTQIIVVDNDSKILCQNIEEFKKHV